MLNRMGWQPRQAPQCPACRKPVYQVEQIIARDRQPYHHWCIKCVSCQVSLNSRTLIERNEQLFCNNCYQSIFNPQYFVAHGYQGGLSEQERNRHLEMYEKSQRERAAQQQDVGDGLGLPKPPTTQAKYSISSMVRSSNTAMPNQTRGFALPTLFQIPGQNGPNVGNSGPTSNFTPSAGIDICTLMTIAPSGNMPNYGYSSL